MAGPLQAYGVVVGLALAALVVAPLTSSLGAEGAETGDHPPPMSSEPGRDVASNIPGESPSFFCIVSSST